jgi:hypothetical protein
VPTTKHARSLTCTSSGNTQGRALQTAAPAGATCGTQNHALCGPHPTRLHHHQLLSSALLISKSKLPRTRPAGVQPHARTPLALQPLIIVVNPGHSRHVSALQTTPPTLMLRLDAPKWCGLTCVQCTARSCRLHLHASKCPHGCHVCSHARSSPCQTLCHRTAGCVQPPRHAARDVEAVQSQSQDMPTHSRPCWRPNRRPAVRKHNSC